jgi:hypothetical protein
MTVKKFVTAIVMIGLALGLGYGVLNVYQRAASKQCYACRRTIHAHMRTVGVVNGHARVFCCPACAFSEHEQEGKPVQITELTDFLTGAKLSPADAFIVKGSDLNMCAHTHELIGTDKQAADVRFDRCAPSLLAMGDRSEALKFAREHGGEVLPFNEIASAFTH